MLPEQVIWTEGMFVQPQHMQQQARYTDAQITQRGLMLSHHGWGFTEFAIDEQCLALGKVVLSRACGMLPDGALFEIGHGQEALQFDVEPGTTNRTVVLSLPIAHAGSSLCRDEENKGLSTRLIAHSVDIRDYNAGKIKEKTILCGKQDLRLMYQEDTDLSGYVSIPIVEIIECKQDKGVTINKDFLPTFLHLSASSTLAGYLKEIIGLVSHRADQLAQRISNAGTTGTAEYADFMLLQNLNRIEPVLKHLDKTPNLRPEEFFRFLLSLVGELSSFVESNKRPGDLPEYKHTDQHTTFKLLMDHARYALSMVLEQHAVELPMQERKYGIIVSPIHDRNLLSSASFILVVKADMDQDMLRNSLPKQLKISPVEQIRDKVNLHLPGVKLSSLPVAPRQIPFHAGKSYFRLEFTSEELAQLELSGGFAFYVSGTFPGLQLQFWAIKE
jgi:type VI secretion protein, VC_A0114 family